MLQKVTKFPSFSRTLTQVARFSTPYLDTHLDIAHGQFTAISTLCSQPLNAGQLSAALMVSRMSTLLAEGQAFVLSLPAPIPFTKQHPPYVALDKIAQLNWDTFQASYHDLRDPDQVRAPNIPDAPGYTNFLDDRLPSFFIKWQIVENLPRQHRPAAARLLAAQARLEISRLNTLATLLEWDPFANPSTG